MPKTTKVKKKVSKTKDKAKKTKAKPASKTKGCSKNSYKNF